MVGYPVSFTQRVIWRDLDALQHVNNAVYATYFETARFMYFEALARLGAPQLGVMLAEITITYKSPAFLGETLMLGIRVCEMRNSSYVMESEIHEQRSGRLVATSRAVMVSFDFAENRSRPLPPEWRQAVAQVEGHEF